jgi:hypothetical protein
VRPVLRIWHEQPDFATFYCARCDLRGYARSGKATVDQSRLAAIRAEMAQRDKATAAHRLRLARSLWQRRQSPDRSIVEVYLHDVRRCVGEVPATIGFLPATDHHPPAMISAFGIATEPEPGRLSIPLSNVTGVHLTRLRADGRGKADTDAPTKVMIGRSIGSPIVLAPANDLLGLVIAEGIETGLSLWEALGTGVWAAGGAGRMPALADAVPDWIDNVVVAVEDDVAGRRGAEQLAARLAARGIRVELVDIITGLDKAA